MTDAASQAWLCKHCNERVDPTMELCWSCGRDREGDLDPADFINQIDVDVTRCTACEYLLKGNSDATRCPECDEPVPWIECEQCGVRGSRAEMIGGCPACRIADTGVTFDHAVSRLGIADSDGQCRQCGYDMHALPNATSCPECGFQADHEVYDSARIDPVEKVLSASVRRHAQFVNSRLIAFGAVFFLGGCLLTGFMSHLFDNGNVIGAYALLTLWLLPLAILFVELGRAVFKKPSDFSE